jgi:hypothetical protein
VVIDKVSLRDLTPSATELLDLLELMNLFEKPRLTPGFFGLTVAEAGLERHRFEALFLQDCFATLCSIAKYT